MSEVERPGEVRVLVVDDDADSREVTAAFLRSSGFDVAEFENAEDALAHASSADAVVTDITLPGMNGYELARRLRAQPREKSLVLFALSGRSDTSPDQARLFDRVVVKPFDPDALADALAASTAHVVPSVSVPSARAPNGSDGHAAAARATGAALSLEEYRLLVEDAPTMIWRVGRDGRCDFVNHTWLAFTGHSRDDFDEVVHPDDRARREETLRQHLASRQPFELHYRLRRHDGEHRTVLERAVPHHDAGAAFAGFVGSCIDVEDSVQGERAKTAFLGMMAHEMRTPLTPLRAYQVQIQRLQQRGEPLTGELVKRFVRQIDRIAALVETLGDAGRLHSRRPLMVSLEPCDFAAVVANAVAKHQEKLDARRDSSRTPKLRFSGPASACPVIGDPKRLAQLVGTLVDNAIKFSSDGGTVTVTLATEADRHRLVVADEGIGIPPAELASIGKVYFRASNAPAENYPGLGLGLAVAKEVVTAHGGTLEATNGPRGLVVTATLPVARDGQA